MPTSCSSFSIIVSSVCTFLLSVKFALHFLASTTNTMSADDGTWLPLNRINSPSVISELLVTWHLFTARQNVRYGTARGPYDPVFRTDLDRRRRVPRAVEVRRREGCSNRMGSVRPNLVLSRVFWGVPQIRVEIEYMSTYKVRITFIYFYNSSVCCIRMF